MMPLPHGCRYQSRGKVRQMTDCGSCRFAEWDYEEFSNSTEKWWFVSGCQKNLDDTEGDNCDGYEGKDM